MSSLVRQALLALVVATAPLAGACSAVVGDACETQTDCGASLFCERSMPEGYCTLADCHERGCPDEGVCIVFDPDTSYCMAPCESNGDCRDGYACVEDFGPHPFCNDARGEPPSGDGGE